MGIAPAGFEKANTGHHHLLVDTELPPFDQPIPNDFNHLHFGAGQTEAKITLPLGPHKLRLLFATSHVPHDPPVYSERIQCDREPDRPPAVPAAAGTTATIITGTTITDKAMKAALPR